MKKIFRKILLTTIVLFGGFIMSSGCTHFAQPEKNDGVPDQKEILCRLKKYPYTPFFPPASDRKAWLKISPEIRQKLIREAEKSAKTPWPMLLAKDYMRFRRNGDRATYEKSYCERRYRLVDLVAGECCEYSGRFMDDIIEGIWQILSEPAWCVPAHEALKADEVLPDPSRFQVDLFNASTGKILADTLQLLGPELAKRSPALVRRVEMEIMRRVIEPAERLNDENTWWFCGRNNWTVWCSSNLAGCAIYLLDKEPERLAAFLNTYLTISRRFYTRYPADGGCNEGPSYWRHAVGKYIQFLAQLDQRLQLNGKLFDDDKLRKMSEYLPGMNLCGNWFLNTNDAYPKPVFSPEFLYFSAQKINSIQLAELAQRISPPSKNTRVAELDNLLLDIFNTVPAKRIESSFLPVNFWPQLGIAILRQKPENPEKGTIVSLKGGFNAESHNHLDLGNFTLMRNKKPLIVDVGPGVYTAQTFSERRYEIWHLGAQGHNAPRFSGKEQIYGKEYSAALTLQKDTAVSACLDKAYPPEAGVSKLTRTIALDRVTGNVDITDTAVLTGSKKVEITLYTAVKPENFDRRQVVWKQGRLETEQLEVVNVSEETRMDATLKKNWKKLWRIDLAGKSGKAGTWKLKFRF